jgi:hypothetical protein
VEHDRLLRFGWSLEERVLYPANRWIGAETEFLWGKKGFFVDI